MQLKKDSFYSLIATGAPGGTRVLILFLAGYLFDSAYKETISNLLFILISVNLICSQSISSLLYNNKYKQQAIPLAIFSIPLVVFSFFLALALSYFSNEKLSLAFLFSVLGMHFYTFARFYAISVKSLQRAFIAELSIFIIVISYFFIDNFGSVDAFFYTLTLSYFISAFIMMISNSFMGTSLNVIESKFSLLKTVLSLALSNVSSSMVLYLIPFYFALFDVGDKVHEIALLISIISTILLLPRVYANREISKVSGYKKNELIDFNSKYNKVSIVSGGLGVMVCIGFALFKSFTISPLCFLVLPILVVLTQLNFVYSMYLSSHGAENSIRNVHLLVIATVAIGLLVLYYFNKYIELSSLEVLILLIIAISLSIRGVMFKKCFYKVFQERDFD